MRNIIMTALLGAALAFTAPAFAAPEKAPAEKTESEKPSATVARIAVVGVEELIQGSKAGKSIQAQIAKQRESFKGEFTSLEKDLAEMQKKIAENKAAPDSKELEAQKKEFDTKLNNANKLVQQRRQTLEQGATEAAMQLRKKIVELVAEIADQEKYTIVISRQDVILAEKDMDITDRVLARLDKELPDVKLKLDAPKAAPAAEEPKKK